MIQDKRYMLDTNTVSYLIRAHPAVTRRLVNTSMALLCISTITESELFFGLSKQPNAKKLHIAVHEFLKHVDILPYNSSVSEHYGSVRANMEKQGKILAPLDWLIAAHALSIGAVLVTS